ncbi:uncharacterized protein LOC106166155 [Lingula anatina]|uniref:Uncharacterized protein LOC106166155 n=1 Tax=Lingula anatina TaxID=7574 RepID=A0A1S3IPD3_LINAN|nr:uncharacterized protein LOC106166155 [Lingula anatina]|eukprot:XP_013400075.1 uncharacterized protein LOC106166155 [Lingula anatina]
MNVVRKSSFLLNQNVQYLIKFNKCGLACLQSHPDRKIIFCNREIMLWPRYLNKGQFDGSSLRRPAQLCHHPFTRVQSYSQRSGPDQDQQSQHGEHGHYSRIMERLVTIENDTRLYGYSTLRIGGAVVISTGIAVYLFREQIRENVADEVSQVTTRSLSDENVQNKAQDLALALLNEILTDKNIQDLSVVFLQNVFGQPGTQETASKLLEDVLTDSTVQANLTEVFKTILVSAFGDSNFRNNLAQNLEPLLRHESVIYGVQQLFIELFKSKTVQEEAAKFLSEVITKDIVVEQATKLGKAATNNIVKDTEVQQEVGNALWSSAGYALTPSFLGSKTKVT